MTNIGNNVFFSFLYIAGEINKINCISKNGRVKMNEANKDIFKFDKKISGNAVKNHSLILRILKKIEKRFRQYLADERCIVKKKKIKQSIKNRKLNSNLLLNSLR